MTTSWKQKYESLESEQEAVLERLDEAELQLSELRNLANEIGRQLSSTSDLKKEQWAEYLSQFVTTLGLNIPIYQLMGVVNYNDPYYRYNNSPYNITGTQWYNPPLTFSTVNTANSLIYPIGV